MLKYILLLSSTFLLSACIEDITASTPVLTKTFRVVTYNVANNPDNESEDNNIKTIFTAIKSINIEDINTKPSIIALQETDSTSVIRFVSLINQLYSVQSYEYIQSTSVGGDRTALIYDTSTFVLESYTELTNPELTRPVLRGKLKPINGKEYLYFYVIHLKSGSSSSAEDIRKVEAEIIVSDASLLADGNKIFLGDFNLTGASEGAWLEFMRVAFDPINSIGEWRDSPSFIEIHTQDPGASMNDRFDFQLISATLLDNTGIDYVEGSYTTLGNNGSHVLKSTLNTGNGATPDIMNALMSSSDHLPVIADYSYTF